MIRWAVESNDNSSLSLQFNQFEIFEPELKYINPGLPISIARKQLIEWNVSFFDTLPDFILGYPMGLKVVIHRDGNILGLKVVIHHDGNILGLKVVIHYDGNILGLKVVIHRDGNILGLKVFLSAWAILE